MVDHGVDLLDSLEGFQGHLVQGCFLDLCDGLSESLQHVLVDLIAVRCGCDILLKGRHECLGLSFDGDGIGLQLLILGLHFVQGLLLGGSPSGLAFQISDLARKLGHLSDVITVDAELLGICRPQGLFHQGLQALGHVLLLGGMVEHGVEVAQDSSGLSHADGDLLALFRLLGLLLHPFLFSGDFLFRAFSGSLHLAIGYLLGSLCTAFGGADALLFSGDDLPEWLCCLHAEELAVGVVQDLDLFVPHALGLSLLGDGVVHSLSDPAVGVSLVLHPRPQSLDLSLQRVGLLDIAVPLFPRKLQHGGLLSVGLDDLPFVLVLHRSLQGHAQDLTVGQVAGFGYVWGFGVLVDGVADVVVSVSHFSGSEELLDVVYDFRFVNSSFIRDASRIDAFFVHKVHIECTP